jgi:hypothetical protein
MIVSCIIRNDYTRIRNKKTIYSVEIYRSLTYLFCGAITGVFGVFNETNDLISLNF